MHNSNIPKFGRYLVSNTRVLEPVMFQGIFFDSRLGDTRPFHMSVADRNAKNKDQSVEFSTDDLVENLAIKDMGARVEKWREDVVMICEYNGISIKKMKWIEYSKYELIEKLTRKKSICARRNKTEVTKFFQENGNPVKFEEEENKQVWDGKTKFMLKILWQQGCIDEANWKLYKNWARWMPLDNGVKNTA